MTVTETETQCKKKIVKLKFVSYSVNVICGAPELVLSYRPLCIFTSVFILSSGSRALTLTSCLRIDLITWHSSQARVPRSYQLFHIRTNLSPYPLPHPFSICSLNKWVMNPIETFGVS